MGFSLEIIGGQSVLQHHHELIVSAQAQSGIFQIHLHRILRIAYDRRPFSHDLLYILGDSLGQLRFWSRRATLRSPLYSGSSGRHLRRNDNAFFHFFLYLTDTIQDSFLICLHLRLAQLDQRDLYQDTLLRRIADLSGQFGENMDIADDLIHGKHGSFFLQIRQIIRGHIYDILQIVRRLY